MGEIMINIAADFSEYPAGRIAVDGPNNGERFRREILIPKLLKAIEAGDHVRVSLDGLFSCGSSFLDSAFGGLIRDDGFKKEDIKKHLQISATAVELYRYRDSAMRYIANAKFKKTSD